MHLDDLFCNGILIIWYWLSSGPVPSIAYYIIICLATVRETDSLVSLQSPWSKLFCLILLCKCWEMFHFKLLGHCLGCLGAACRLCATSVLINNWCIIHSAANETDYIIVKMWRDERHYCMRLRSLMRLAKHCSALTSHSGSLSLYVAYVVRTTHLHNSTVTDFYVLILQNYR